MGKAGIKTSVVALLLGALVAGACSSGDDDTTTSGSGSDSGGGAWSYVDGAGQEIALDETPDRIVAHASSAAALIPMGIRPVGIFADQPIEEDLTLQGLDLEGIEIVGEEWGVINLEAVAELEPDIVVTDYWALEDAHQGIEEETTGEQLREIAPVVGPAQGASIVTMIEDYAALAASLGADVESPEVQADRDRFEAAKATFETAIAAKPGLSVMAVSPTEEGIYVAVPEHSSELSDLTSWGLNVLVPDTPDEGFEYWETVSWENAGKYQADLLLVDERFYPENVEEAELHPSWSFLAAAEAEAVTPWPAYLVRNYAAYADFLDRFTAAIGTTDENLVP